MSSSQPSLQSENSATTTTVTSVPAFSSMQSAGQPQEQIFTDIIPMLVFMIVMWTITLRQLRTP